MADGIVTYGDASRSSRPRREQHDAYVAALAGAGWEVREVPQADDLPDSAFVEEPWWCAAISRAPCAPVPLSGAPSWRGTDEAGSAGSDCELARTRSPGTLDGGDVLRVGEDLYVGRGGRTYEEGIRRVGSSPGPRGYEVVTVPLRRVLHLKSAVTALPDGTMICLVTVARRLARCRRSGRCRRRPARTLSHSAVTRC